MLISKHIIKETEPQDASRLMNAIPGTSTVSLSLSTPMLHLEGLPRNLPSSLSLVLVLVKMLPQRTWREECGSSEDIAPASTSEAWQRASPYTKCRSKGRSDGPGAGEAQACEG